MKELNTARDRLQIWVIFIVFYAETSVRACIPNRFSRSKWSRSPWRLIFFSLWYFFQNFTHDLHYLPCVIAWSLSDPKSWCFFSPILHRGCINYSNCVKSYTWIEFVLLTVWTIIFNRLSYSAVPFRLEL